MAHALGLPVVGRLHDAFFAGGDKIPPNVPALKQSVAAHQHATHSAVSCAQQHGLVCGQHCQRLSCKRGALQVDSSIDRVQARLLRQACGQREHPTGRQLDIQVQSRRQADHRRLLPPRLADEHTHRGIAHLQLRYGVGRGVHKAGLRLFCLHRQRCPQLNAVVHIACLRQCLRATLGVHDAFAGRHPVDGAWLDLLHRAQTVAVHDGAREQVGHRGQANVRVRAHIVL